MASGVIRRCKRRLLMVVSGVAARAVLRCSCAAWAAAAAVGDGFSRRALCLSGSDQVGDWGNSDFRRVGFSVIGRHDLLWQLLFWRGRRCATKG